jgi:hypothetical protein
MRHKPRGPAGVGHRTGDWTTTCRVCKTPNKNPDEELLFAHVLCKVTPSPVTEEAGPGHSGDIQPCPPVPSG